VVSIPEFNLPPGGQIRPQGATRATGLENLNHFNPFSVQVPFRHILRISARQRVQMLNLMWFWRSDRRGRQSVGLRARFIESFDLRNVSLHGLEHRDAATGQKAARVARGRATLARGGSKLKEDDSSLGTSSDPRKRATIPRRSAAPFARAAVCASTPRVTPGQKQSTDRCFHLGVHTTPRRFRASVISTCIASWRGSHVVNPAAAARRRTPRRVKGEAVEPSPGSRIARCRRQVARTRGSRRTELCRRRRLATVTAVVRRHREPTVRSSNCRR